MDRGADANVGAGTYGSPLQSACAFGSVRGVEFLLGNCPEIDVNAQGGKYGSALQAAVQSGEMRAVELLLKRGAGVNGRGGKYGSALNAAVVKSSWDMVEVLLGHGAEPRLPEMDAEWLTSIEKEHGPGTVERYNKFREAHQ
ncbi:hypothetical protein MAPG_11653 [Magnaporthiopsis poae ATCC 64411]|uniref:Uncharacterized protein n=1 Tax=Magnaporthiopsis poae (strain ATCC 64411 / 73-15) TaxID=644358 RepID=A0A0C4EFU5_MAGP6|nr:hypothetical protein MAPG_11653 [Magnaporthiopsis poae ATCC 64411]